MFQINLEGFIESENPDKLVQKIESVIKESNSDLIGRFNIFLLPPYVDYQNAEVTDVKEPDV